MSQNDEQNQRRIRVPRAKILIVDDLDVNRLIAEAMLRKFAVKPDMAQSGQEALDMTSEKDYDLIFMDHIMPGIDGVEATKRLRGRGGHYAAAPIVALTGNAEDDIDISYITEGFSGHILKPLEEETLEECLKKFLPPELIL
ncbi:MAG: response regulator [Oscillospiraceae bacterium]|jgi:CheY-like chemotaxis protein|nr:response regulator [Oscillospiraceae bacterium]